MVPYVTPLSRCSTYCLKNQPFPGSSMLPSHWHPFVRRRASASLLDILLRTRSLINTLRAMQEAALLHRTAALAPSHGTTVTVAVAIAIRSTSGPRWRQVRNVLRKRMLRAHIGDAAFRCFAGFGKCVVARVEVLTLLVLVSCWCRCTRYWEEKDPPSTYFAGGLSYSEACHKVGTASAPLRWRTDSVSFPSWRSTTECCTTYVDIDLVLLKRIHGFGLRPMALVDGQRAATMGNCFLESGEIFGKARW